MSQQERTDPAPVRENRRSGSSRGRRPGLPVSGARRRRSRRRSRSSSGATSFPLGHLVQRHLRQGVGPEEQHQRHRRQHQPGGSAGARRLGGLGEEGPRPLHVPVAAGGVRAAGHRHDQRLPEVEKKHGKKIDLAHKSTFNPKTKKYFAFSDAYTPDPGNWHKDWWTEAGYPNGPDTYEDLLKGAKKIRDKNGHPCGIGLVAGARHQHGDARHPVVLRRRRAGRGRQRHDQLQADDRSAEVRQGALSADRDAEVFTWTPPSNNQGMLAGPPQLRGERHLDHAPVGAREAAHRLKIMISPALKGPVRRIAAEHVMNCYVDLGVRREQGRRAEVPDRLDRPLPRRLRRRSVLQLPLLPLDGARTCRS